MNPRVSNHPPQILHRALIFGAIIGLIAIDTQECLSQEDGKAQRLGYMIEVPLPLTLDKAATVKQTVRNLLENTPIINDQLPVFVMQFATTRGETGIGSDFNACAALAEFLASPEMSRIKAVAYVPPLRRSVAGVPDAKLAGHAVLVALACEEIVLHESASFGEAGIDTSNITPPMKSTYQFIAGKRSPLPEPVTLSMLERSQTLFEVPTLNGEIYVDAEEADRLVREGKTSIVNELVDATNLGLFDAERLASFSTNCHAVENSRSTCGSVSNPSVHPRRRSNSRKAQFSSPIAITQFRGSTKCRLEHSSSRCQAR